MQANVPIDIADALQEALNAVGVLTSMGITACAEPIPRDLSDRLPLTLVQPMGAGGRTDVVVDRFAVRLYTWAGDEPAAMDAARCALSALCLVEGEFIDGTRIYRVVPTSMPYPAPDPERPDLARACFTAYVWARANTIEM